MTTAIIVLTAALVAALTLAACEWVARNRSDKLADYWCDKYHEQKARAEANGRSWLYAEVQAEQLEQTAAATLREFNQMRADHGLSTRTRIAKFPTGGDAA